LAAAAGGVAGVSAGALGLAAGVDGGVLAEAAGWRGTGACPVAPLLPPELAEGCGSNPPMPVLPPLALPLPPTKPLLPEPAAELGV
jgi:hypothetical protein